MANAISFDGSSQYGQIDNFTAINSLTNYTAEYWVKNTATSAAYSPIFNLEDTDGTDYLFRFGTENGIGNQGFNFATRSSASYADGYESSDRLIQETWVQVSEAYNHILKKTQIFINGVENNDYNSQATLTGTIQDPTDMVFHMAKYFHGAPDYFDGDIGGYLRVWTRALTGAEIYYNYDKQLTAANEDSSLIVNCNFSEGSGSTVDNDATAGADLDLVNSPSWVTGPTLSAKSYTNSYHFNQVAASSDDAEEDTGTSTSIDSSDLEIVNDGATTQDIGIRFDNVAIPAGATIQSAYLRLVGDESQSSGTENAIIYGEDADDGTTFGTGGTAVTGKTTTTASVDWDGVAATVPGTIATTPDLTTIVQEIIDRGGWATGQAMVFIILPNGSNATRTFESYDGQFGSAPMLHVEYTETAGGTYVNSYIGPGGYF